MKIYQTPDFDEITYEIKDINITSINIDNNVLNRNEDKLFGLN